MKLRRVVGESMMPALKPGQIVLIARRRKLHDGDVVIMRHDGLEKIKRIARMDERNVFVLGDNPARSTDSRQFGWVEQRAIAGKVIWPRSR